MADETATAGVDEISGKLQGLEHGGQAAIDAGARVGPRVATSSYRGVCWHRKSRRWQAAINSSGRHVYLGSFDTEEEAARMFDKVALRVRGSRAKLNFPYEDYVGPNGEIVTDPKLEALVREARKALIDKQRMLEAQEESGVGSKRRRHHSPAFLESEPLLMASGPMGHLGGMGIGMGAPGLRLSTGYGGMAPGAPALGGALLLPASACGPPHGAHSNEALFSLLHASMHHSAPGNPHAGIALTGGVVLAPAAAAAAAAGGVSVGLGGSRDGLMHVLASRGGPLPSPSLRSPGAAEPLHPHQQHPLHHAAAAQSHARAPADASAAPGRESVSGVAAPGQPARYPSTTPPSPIHSPPSPVIHPADSKAPATSPASTVAAPAPQQEPVETTKQEAQPAGAAAAAPADASRQRAQAQVPGSLGNGSTASQVARFLAEVSQVLPQGASVDCIVPCHDSSLLGYTWAPAPGASSGASGVNSSSCSADGSGTSGSGAVAGGAVSGSCSRVGGSGPAAAACAGGAGAGKVLTGAGAGVWVQGVIKELGRYSTADDALTACQACMSVLLDLKDSLRGVSVTVAPPQQQAEQQRAAAPKAAAPPAQQPQAQAAQQQQRSAGAAMEVDERAARGVARVQSDVPSRVAAAAAAAAAGHVAPEDPAPFFRRSSCPVTPSDSPSARDTDACTPAAASAPPPAGPRCSQCEGPVVGGEERCEASREVSSGGVGAEEQLAADTLSRLLRAPPAPVDTQRDRSQNGSTAGARSSSPRSAFAPVAGSGQNSPRRAQLAAQQAAQQQAQQAQQQLAAQQVAQLLQHHQLQQSRLEQQQQFERRLLAVATASGAAPAAVAAPKAEQQPRPQAVAAAGSRAPSTSGAPQASAPAQVPPQVQVNAEALRRVGATPVNVGSLTVGRQPVAVLSSRPVAQTRPAAGPEQQQLPRGAPAGYQFHPAVVSMQQLQAMHQQLQHVQHVQHVQQVQRQQQLHPQGQPVFGRSSLQSDLSCDASDYSRPAQRPRLSAPVAEGRVVAAPLVLAPVLGGQPQLVGGRPMGHVLVPLHAA